MVGKTVVSQESSYSLGAIIGRAPWGRPLMAELLESIPDPVIGCDDRGSIVYWGTAARERYGFSPDEAIGRPVVELLRTRFPAPLLEITEEVTDLGHWEGVLVHRAKDGSQHTVESRWVARYDDGGRLVGGFAIERAVTGLDELERGRGSDARRHQRLELDRQRAERLDSVAELAGGVSHDFNNQLGIVINYAAFVAAELERIQASTGDLRFEAMRADLGEIQCAAERGAALTHQLMAFAHQEGGEPEPVDLNVAITELEPLLARTVGAHIRLQFDLGAELERVWIEPAQIQQVLINLAANARDAMPRGGSLSIATCNTDLDAAEVAGRAGLEPGHHVRLRVSDEGVGMAPDELERAFDPLFTTQPIGQGTGVGLSSAHGIVTRARGHAELSSEPGAGTTFVAHLPVAPPCAGAALPALARPVEDAAASETVLLVEDEPQVP